MSSQPEKELTAADLAIVRTGLQQKYDLIHGDPVKWERYRKLRQVLHELKNPLTSGKGFSDLITDTYPVREGSSVLPEEVGYFAMIRGPMGTLSQIYNRLTLTDPRSIDEETLKDGFGGYDVLLALLSNEDDKKGAGVVAWWLAETRIGYQVNSRIAQAVIEGSEDIDINRLRLVEQETADEVYEMMTRQIKELGVMGAVVEEMNFYVRRLVELTGVSPEFGGRVHREIFTTGYKTIKRKVTELAKAMPDVKMVLGWDRYVANLGQTELGDVVNQLVKDLTGENDRVEVAVGNGLMVMTDREPFELALRQVVVNALKYGVTVDSEGRHIPEKVEISAEEVDDEVVIRIVDHGVGIQPNMVARLNEGESGRAEEVRDSFEGTGFGMTLATDLLNKLSARMVVESEGLGKGTTVKLFLPKNPGLET